MGHASSHESVDEYAAVAASIWEDAAADAEAAEQRYHLAERNYRQKLAEEVASREARAQPEWTTEEAKLPDFTDVAIKMRQRSAEEAAAAEARYERKLAAEAEVRQAVMRRIASRISQIEVNAPPPEGAERTKTVTWANHAATWHLPWARYEPFAVSAPEAAELTAEPTSPSPMEALRRIRLAAQVASTVCTATAGAAA